MHEAKYEASNVSATDYSSTGEVIRVCRGSGSSFDVILCHQHPIDVRVLY